MRPLVSIIALAISLSSSVSVSGTDVTLREAGALAGIYMGSQFKYDSIFNSSIAPGATNEYRDVHSKQYGLSTVGNDCKWAAMHPARDTYTLEKCQQSIGYALGAGQAFRGHNLCWGNNNPSWLEALAASPNTSASELRAVLTGHVTTVMRGVPNATAWDVVNEAAPNQPANSTDFFKPNTWFPLVPNYVDAAFVAARAADPRPLLFYNEYGAEEAGTAKSDVVYSMVKSMVRRGVPIDGVGLQLHVGTPQGGQSGGRVINATRVAENIARLGALGLQVHITELDVKCPDPCPASALAAQAQVYADLLRACLSSKGVCTSFETWGFTDAMTWLTGSRCKGAANCHPLPFDEQYAPKPAVAAMLAVLAEFARARAP
eukprot:g4922.t1